jgi:hypothetical protein
MPWLFPRGEKVNTAKLTPRDVYAIRVRIARGEKHMPLSKEYGVAVQSIYFIAKFQTWRHLLLPAPPDVLERYPEICAP